MRHEVSSLELIPGSGGVFEIKVNDELIFSKFETDQFPDHMEIINTLQRKLQQSQ
ncbi:Rdx family protein [Salisediminibacterium beveridgei]|uniref:Selenoprotein W-related protein n=1 Tax=Salisediminibacterium beveridgei TaxID=632773 RepID=A0A1D7QVN2_9BACI|nr:Rdx family protein [Salisediminibacterium beveridgei]AOM83073.1 hypothetical protein BBEV_1712 [Salisediminibacterium beveridgei]